MKTQISKQHTNVVAVQPLTTFPKEDRMKKHSSALLKLGAICTMVVTLTLTASATWPACDPAPTTTMVAWYPFDELSGPSRNVATQNSGIWNGGLVPNWGGLVGYSLGFDGSTGYIDSPSSTATNFGPAGSGGPSSCGGVYSTCQGDFSIGVWIRVSNLSPNQVYTILDKRSGSVPNIYGYTFALYNDRLLLQLADGTGPYGYTNFLSSVTLGLNSSTGWNGTGWNHVAVTVSRMSAITFYLNGSQVGAQFSPTGRLGSLVNNSPLRIGANLYGPTSFFSGYMDELQMWNRSLIPIEVANIFNAGWTGMCK